MRAASWAAAAPEKAQKTASATRLLFMTASLSPFKRGQEAIGLNQILLEKRDGAVPGELGRGFVVARGGVVVEAVLGAGVGVDLVLHAGGLHGLLHGRVHGVDALVVLGELDEERGLDLRHRGGLGGGAVVRDAGLHLRAER